MSELARVSPQIRTLVTALGSPVAVELLLFLRHQEGKSFSAKALGAALHVTRDVESLLERLAGLNMLDVHIRGEVRYSYAPAAQAELVSELDREYTFRFRQRSKADG